MSSFIIIHICAMLVFSFVFILATNIAFKGNIEFIWINAVLILDILWLAGLVILSFKKFKNTTTSHGE